jgi:hypothetical protein
MLHYQILKDMLFILDDDSAFKGTDKRTREQFRCRVGSIVRKPSLGSNGNVDTLTGNCKMFHYYYMYYGNILSK